MVLRRAVAVILAVLGLVGGTGARCSPPVRVLVIGDSLTVRAAKAGLADRDRISWTVQAAEGLATGPAVNLAREHDLDDYDLVIVALGSNDHASTAAAYGAHIDRMMAVLGSSERVVWVNVDRGQRVLARALGVNQAIVDAPRRHPNLEVGGWYAHTKTVAGFSRMRDADGIHYTAAGSLVRSRWMADLVAR